jgi:hypothetical protein
MTIGTNLISAELSDEVLNSSVDSIKQVENNLQFLLTVQTEDKVGLVKVGASIMEFNRMTYDYALKNPEIKPQYLDLIEFQKDLELSQKIKVLINHLVPLVDKLNDTLAVVAAEAYFAGRLFYHHAKNAAVAGVPGASAIADELGKLYQRKPAKLKEPSPAQE